MLVIWRAKPHQNRDFAHESVVRQIAGFGLFLLGIAHLPIIWELCPGGVRRRIGAVGAVTYLMFTRRTRTCPLQNAHKPTLVRISPVM